MKRIIRLVDRVFGYFYWRQSRAKTRAFALQRANVPNPTTLVTRRGETPDAPLNRFEQRLLIIAKVLLEKLRSCDLCTKSDDQEYFIQYSDGYEVHVDCGAEYNDACSVDPTTQYLGESDADWRSRCHALGFE